MFIRRTITNRITYYQVVESVVINGKTHQRQIVSLGREPNPLKALESMELDLVYERSPEPLTPPETPKERAVRLKRIARLRERIAALAEVLGKRKLPGYRLPRRRVKQS